MILRLDCPGDLYGWGPVLLVSGSFRQAVCGEAVVSLEPPFRVPAADMVALVVV